MNLESSNIILRTSSVATGSDKDTNRTNITWRNVNLQIALGSLYGKYKMYKICLTSVGNVNTTAITNIVDRVVTVNLSGLQFVNQTYDTASNTVTGTAVISTLYFNTGNGFSVNYTGEIGSVFVLPKGALVDINISLTKVSDGTVPNINYGESVFCFSVYGIHE